MGVSTSDLDCACTCEDRNASKYAEGDAGQPTRGTECPWQDEDVVPAYPKAVTSTPSKDIVSHRRSNQGLETTPATTRSHVSPGWGSNSPSPFRPPIQDLQKDGTYLLHFSYHPGDRFGLDLVEIRDESDEGFLVVSRVDPLGAFSYTSDCTPGLFPGDVIVEANELRGAASWLRDVVNQVALAGGILDVIAQPRPAIFEVTIRRDGPLWKKLGLSVAIDREDKHAHMRVRSVREEGLVAQWNEANGGKRVCTGDWIIEVNGVRRSAEEMFKLISTSTEGEMLSMKVQIPSRETPRQELEIDNYDREKGDKSRLGRTLSLKSD